MGDFLKYEQDGKVATLTMNDPDNRNPLTGNSAAAEFVAMAARIEADPSVRVVILTGAGAAFSAGGNVKDMKKYQGDAIQPMPIRDEYRRGIQRLTLAMYNLDVPLIAAVNGFAIGAGCDLACMCDIRIAAESAKFAESFIKVGIIPGDGGAWLLPRVVGMSKAAEMAFTGEMLDAQAALSCGLVSRVVPDDQLMQTARELADRIAANPGPTLRLTKRLLREGQVTRLDSLLELSAAYQALAHKTAEHAEAVNAFIEKRKPDFG
ncbi:crotonase/enoyl-CoA hydratase family protein [Thalassobius vesicularis]|uniref:Crotonase/enoyl-CoA hydratase family protein n=1 Tax=Thalassobius vesicularis TaxID=1294297 RepID=A0A4S3MB04_9RHOB|nr:crotonase/enoyl-CoA hydratase family protein [Thalassobius vesicularis]THD75039.1 crotonase/enoyl-CoA hydratase family protein [Thalassobius vesicularis]